MSDQGRRGGSTHRGWAAPHQETVGPGHYDPGHVQPLQLRPLQDEIRRTFAVDRDETGNLPPLPGIFPDHWHPNPCRGRRTGADDDALGLLPAAAEGRTQPVTKAQRPPRPTGGPGSSRRIAASCQSPRSASTPIRSPVRRQFGSPSTKPAALRLRGYLAALDSWRGPKRDEPVVEEHQLFSFPDDGGERRGRARTTAACRAAGPETSPIRRCRSSRTRMRLPSSTRSGRMPGSGVGGFVQLTTILRDGITTKVLHGGLTERGLRETPALRSSSLPRASWAGRKYADRDYFSSFDF